VHGGFRRRPETYSARSHTRSKAPGRPRATRYEQSWCGCVRTGAMCMSERLRALAESSRQHKLVGDLRNARNQLDHPPFPQIWLRQRDSRRLVVCGRRFSSSAWPSISIRMSAPRCYSASVRRKSNGPDAFLNVLSLHRSPQRSEQPQCSAPGWS
jgi:hypothetical protein